jgi:hypothetical protein
MVVDGAEYQRTGWSGQSAADLLPEFDHWISGPIGCCRRDRQIAGEHRTSGGEPGRAGGVTRPPDRACQTSVSTEFSQVL